MGFGDWVDNFGEKLGNTLDSAKDFLLAGPGLAIDLTKATIDGPGGKTWGDALNNTAKKLRGGADLIIDNGTITGYGLNQLAKGSEYVYRKEITPLVTQPMTYATHGIQTGDWSLDNFDAAGEANQTAGAGGDDLTMSQSISMLGTTLGGKVGQAIGTGEGDLMFDPLGEDPEAQDWDDYQALLRKHMGSEDAIAANVLTGLGDAAATWWADPAYLALKPIGVLRQIRRDAPLSPEAAANVRKAFDRAATSKAKTYGLPKGLLMNDQADRVESVVGTFDEVGNYTPGYIRGMNADQIKVAFPQLKDGTAYGNQVAKWLDRTNKIDDDATRVNLQKDILAVAYGDMSGLKNIQKLREEGQQWVSGFNDLPDMVDDAISGRVNGSVVGQVAEVSGLTPAWGAEVATITEAKRKLKNIPGTADVEQLFGSLQNKTLVPTAAGKRALARHESKGLGRDGTLNTGIDTVDRYAGKPVEWLMKNGKRLGDELVEKPSEYLMRNGLMSPAVRIVKGSFWDLPLKTLGAGYKLSDKLRTPANPGLINLFNTTHLGGVLDGEMRRAGLDDAARQDIMSRLTSVADGDSITAKAIAEDAEKKMLSSLARKYDLNEEFVGELVDQIQQRRTKFFSSVQDQQAASFAPSGDISGRMVRMEDGSERALRADEMPSIVDEDGVITSFEPSPFWDTQRVHATSLIDIKDIDRTLAKRQKLLKDLGDDWYETKRGRYGKKAYDALYNPDGLDASYHVKTALDGLNKYWKAGTLLRMGYPLRILGDDQMRMFASGYGAAVWGILTKEGIPKALGNKNKRIRKALEAQKMELEDDLRDPELVGRLKAEVDEIRKLNRKIAPLQKKVENPSTVSWQRDEISPQLEEMIAERDMLMEQAGNLDIYEVEARLEAVKQTLTTHDFGTIKQNNRLASGRLKTEAGVELDDAYGGSAGIVSKAIVENGAVLDNHVKGTENVLSSGFGGSTSWRDVMPSEKAYPAAWAKTVNQQVRQSRLAQILLKGGTEDDVLHFLRKTPEGRSIARRMPAQANDKERWVANMTQVLDDLLPTPALRELAAKRDLSKADLIAALPNKAEWKPVNGAVADLNIGAGAVSNKVNAGINRIFHFIAEVPTNAVSRHPLFITFYRREANRLASLYKANLGDVAKIDVTEINRIEEQARKNADHQLRQTLFNVASESDAAKTMRYLSPFFAAWQESMVRWGRIAADNPQAITRFQMAFDAPRNLGLTVDEEGNLLEPGTFPEGNNHILIQLPHAWGGKDTRKVENRTGDGLDWVPGMGKGLTVGESSFNLIFNGGGILNPGFGPFAQIPVAYLTEKMADKKEIEHLTKAILPFGVPENALDPLIPATAKRGATLLSAYVPWLKSHTGEYTNMYSTTLQDKIVDFQLQHGRTPTAAEQKKIEKDAHSETRSMAFWRFVNNAVSPAPAAFNGKYESLRKEYQRLMEKGNAEGKDQMWAQDQFVKQYGAEYFLLTKSRSNNPGAVSYSNETAGAVSLYMDELKSVDPKLARMILGEGNKQGFSTAAYRALQSQGITSKKDPDEAARSGVIAQGWDEYNKYMSWANAKAHEMGLKSYRDDGDLKDFMKFARDTIAEDNEQWYTDYTSFNPNEYQELLGGMEEVAGMKKLNTDPLRAVGQDALRSYLGVRKMIGEELERRAASGGASTITAKANSDLAEFFDFSVSELIESSLDFERYYYPIIERDPWLGDDLDGKEAAA